jgi:hypothetical protein
MYLATIIFYDLVRRNKYSKCTETNLKQSYTKECPLAATAKYSSNTKKPCNLKYDQHFVTWNYVQNISYSQ